MTTIAAAGANEARSAGRGQDRAREPRRHDDRVLRLLHLRHRGGARVRAHVLPEIRARDADAQRLSDLRPRLPCAARRLVPVRPFRRSHRTQIDARRHHVDHGARDDADRRAALLRERGRVRAAGAGGSALPAGRGARRRMGRGGADRGRERAAAESAPGTACSLSSGRRSASSSRPAFFWRCSSDSARPPSSPGRGEFPFS